MPDEFEKFLKQRHTTANPDTQRQAIEKGASDLGIDPVDYATAMAYESGGTFDPWQKGPVTKWGQHRGTIQYGEPQQKQYGVFPGQSFEDQVTNSNVKYLKDKGVQPGMGFDQVYAAINGGSVRKNLATQDANTGRTIADNIRNAQQQYRDKVLQRFWGGQEPQDEFAQFKQSQQPDDFQQFLADTPQQPQPPTNPANVMAQPQALPTQIAPQPTQIEGMAPIEAPNAYPQGMPAEQPTAPQQAVTPPAQQNAVVAPVNAQKQAVSPTFATSEPTVSDTNYDEQGNVLPSAPAYNNLERVTFDNKPDDVSNKDYFVNQITSRLASQLNASGSDVEQVLRDQLHTIKGTPLEDIKKGQYYDFQMTPEFAQDVQVAKQQRIDQAKQRLEETVVTGGTLDDAEASAAKTLNPDELSQIVNDPALGKRIEDQKKQYQEALDFYTKAGARHPDIQARRDVGYINYAQAEKEYKSADAEKEAKANAEQQAGFGDPEYRKTHSEAYDNWTQNVLSRFGSFANQAKAAKDSKTNNFYEGRAFAPALHAFGLDNIFGTGEDYRKDYESTQNLTDKPRLSDAELAGARASGQAYKDWQDKYIPVFAQPTTNFLKTAVTALGSDAATIGAGVNRIAGLTAITDALGIKSPNAGIADWLDKQAEKMSVYQLASKKDGTIFDISDVGGDIVGHAPKYLLLAAASGGDPMLVFAGDSLLSNTNKPFSEQLGSLNKAVFTAQLFKGANAIGRALTSKIADSFLSKSTIESLGDSDLKKSALELIDAKRPIPDDLKRAIVVEKLASKGIPAGLVGVVGFGLGKAEGQDNLGAAKQAGIFITQDMLFGLLGKEKGSKLTLDDIKKANGLILRNVDAEGNPHDILLKQNGDKLEGAEIELPKGMTPDAATVSKERTTDQAEKIVETSANSSLDSSASAEAISENAKRKNEGVESVVKVDTRNGKETPVIGPRPEDTPIKPYETIEFRGGSRNGEILIQGDKIAPNYSPPSRLEGEVVKPKQAESLESPDTHEIKDEGASLKDLEAELKGETPSKATEPTTGLTEGSKFTNVSTGKEGELYNDPKLGWRLKTGENSSTTFPNRFWSVQDHIARTDDILASDKTPEQKAREIINNEESVNTQSNSANERTPEARPNSESSGGDKVVTPKPVERPSEELPSEVNAKGVTAEKPIEEGGTDGGKLNEAGVQPKSAETPKELELFKNNKIVTADRVAKIRAEIAKRQGKLTSGIDPVDLALYTELGAAYVEAGARKFADFSKQMIDDLGDEVRPHLDKIYGNVRKHFDFDGMTPDTRTPLEEGKGVAKVGKSIQQKAIEQGLVDEFSDTARYDIKGVEEQAKQVSDLVTSDQPRALRIIRGEEQLPDSINRSMFIDGVERYVKGMDDTVAAGKIISDLMNSDLVTDTSKAAQTLRFLQEREPDSVTAYLKQVQDARKAAAKRQGVSGEDVKALDNRINELEKQLAEKQKASIDKQFEQFINEVKSDQTAAKKKGGSVVDYFNELEAKARARIDKRGESAIFRSSVNPIDPQMLADHAIIGAAHIARGVKRGVEFGDAMVKQFGEKIRPYLDDLWDASDRFYKANATKSKADLTPEQIVASSDGVDRNLINSLVSARVKKGDTSVDNVFSEVTKDIQSKYPEVSEREIRDTFTGYGENKEPTRNDLLRQRNVVRRLAKLQSELEDVRNGKAPWKAEHQGQTKSEYVLAKERELEEAMAKAGIPLRAVKSDAERLTMRKKAMQNELKKIERNLSNGNFAKPERRSIPLDPEGAAIQKELTRAREARNNLGYTTSPEEAETLLHLLKAVDEGRTAMAAGGDPKTTYGVAQVALNNYVNDLKLEAKRYKMADFKANPAGFVAHVLNEAASNTKAIAASMDDSAVFRQGWKVMFTNPTIWAKNGVKSFAHLIKMRGQHEVMDALNADIVSRPTYDLMKKAKLDIGVNEETFPTTLPEHIPVFGRVYKATENAYTAFVRKTRADVFDKYIDIANKTGVELTDTELRGIGRMVNSLTGRGDLGTLEQAGKVVNNVFFSPKFLKSHFDVLGGHIITGGGEGSNFVRKQAAINMLKVVGGTAAILAIAKALNPDSVDLDPRSSDFGKIRVGNTTFDVSGGMGSIATLAARMVLSQTKSSVTGKVYQLGETDENGKLKFGTQTRFDVFLDFFTNKLSPLAGAMRDYYKGQTFDNENPTMMRLTEGLLTPLPVKTAQELWQDPNSAPFLEGLLADFMGISTNTYGGSKGVLRDMQKAKVRGDQKEIERLKPILQEELKIEADKLKRKKAENSNK